MGALVFEPDWPLWAIVLISIVAASIAVLGAIRQPRGAPFRILALAALIALLANPQIRVTERTALDDIAIILTDESASQTLDGRDRITSEAADELEARLKNLGDVEVVRSSVSGDQETRLVEALRSSVSETPRG
ncbi:MAG TPA: hypothetical protein PLV61_11630, partial [Parvularculaceae bacterium]|nr:hypothetical protein [Parvularculaceae bacterium]